MPGVGLTVSGLQRGASSSLEGAAFKDSLFGVASVDDVVQTVNKDVTGEVCYSFCGSACSREKFGWVDMLKLTCLM